MHLTFDNVNTAFKEMVQVFHGFGDYDQIIRKSTSRYGDVLMIDEPVTITYERPVCKVLYSAARDCNPFFHVYEALWILAGRNDVVPLAIYNSRMSEFSDNGVTFNGAYGHRWRHATSIAIPTDPGDDTRIDQLPLIIGHLKRKPDSRRVVLQMWNVEDDLLKIDSSKDVCCNTNIYFALRPGPIPEAQDETPDASTPSTLYLDMTVCNRSNDMVWGMFGANVVHMSFLQEYVAAHLNAEVGKYHQITNNLHVYTARWEPGVLLSEYPRGWIDPYQHRVEPRIIPLVKDPELFDLELGAFVRLYGTHRGNSYTSHLSGLDEWHEPFLQEVAKPMCNAFLMYKDKDYEAATNWVERIKSDDWREVSHDWIQRRLKTKFPANV